MYQTKSVRTSHTRTVYLKRKTAAFLISMTVLGGLGIAEELSGEATSDIISIASLQTWLIVSNCF